MIEPSADMRQAAMAMTTIYVSMTQAGFTPEEAAQITANILVASQKKEGNES